MTATRSAIRRTIPRLWVMNSIPMPRAALLVREQGQDLRLDGDVERRRGLVRDQDVGVVGERHRDHHALALPAGQLVGIGTEPLPGVPDADLGQEFHRPLPCLRADQTLMQREALTELPRDGVKRIERRHRLLEDEADVVAAHPSQRAVVRRGQVGVPVEDPARDDGVLRQKPHGRKCGDRLARAALPDDGEGFARGQVETDAPDCRRDLARLAEVDAEVANRQDRLAGADRVASHRKVFRGSKASRTPSKTKTRSDSISAKVKKAVKPSQGAFSRFLPCSASSPREG
jgi:hypothetical protein